jgi:23S rRNA (uridine2552-2'-O)-methyltransferase
MYEKPDYWTKKAKKEGYRARSVYKLEEIQQKYEIVKSGAKVLDVGAAPGSWSQYVLKLLKGSGLLAAIDLSPVTIPNAPANFRFIQGDIYEQTKIDALALLGPFDVVLSDAAPATTGNRIVDTARSSGLVEHVLYLCGRLLVPGGNLVVKLFQGGDEQDFLSRMRGMFASARILKPKATRDSSFETYLIGTGRK